ncbi:transporter [Atopomonas sediminilitoris]|uniref:transporter n=1 Tax=Atopomonas sediminilitoris TaxID=2919919 RepID=UPI001F4DD998|nr:transporter [Atopomonas sediminilitoris]MCJ8168562.1 transporter [Atopomonas sediminilitoris]
MTQRVIAGALALACLVAPYAFAEQASQEQAREALAKKSDDADTEKALEEVFQAAEKSYTLLKKGERTLTFAADYSLVRDTLVETLRQNGNVFSVVGRSEAQHTFTNSFTFDYGVWDNLTFSVRLPLVAKYDTERDLSRYSVGDVSTSVRWQPWEAVRGKPVYTLYGSLSLPTGDSPYDINPDNDLSTGSGFYSLGFGLNASYIIDPVVLFGSVGYAYNMKVSDVDQVRGGRLLQDVDPGDTLSMSAGFAYSLSYDVSLSASYQMSHSLKTEYTFADGSLEGTESTSALMNFALGVRTDPDTIVNVNAGFGMTEDSPDVLLGISMPLDIKGLKSE